MAAGETQERDIDIVIRQVHRRIPEVEVRQLRVKWPNDDDNLWWFFLPAVEQDIQVEGASCPFLVETNEQSSSEALKARTVDEAVEMVVSYLQSVKAGQPIRLAGELWWAAVHPKSIREPPEQEE